MKRLIISLVAYLGICWTAYGQVTLNAGESFSYSFYQLTPIGIVFPRDYAEVLLTLDEATVQEGDTMLIETFEEPHERNEWGVRSPMCSQIWTWDLTPQCRVLSLGTTGPWHDFDGSVRFSMLTGSVVLKSFTLDLFLGRGGVNAHWSQTIVPGPRLSIAMTGASQAQIRWPTNAPGYGLEFASSLPASGWTWVTNAPAVIGDSFVVTVQQDAAVRFFRLANP